MEGFLQANLVKRAFFFAKKAHESINQRRKYTGDPYIVHPVAVARTVSTVPHTEAMLAAALLHDTVEDTPIELADIQEAFGAEVAELVGWVTDVSRPEDGNRKARKALDRGHLVRASAPAQTIKLADLIHNTESIVRYDPDFARRYLPEKRALLEVLQGGDCALWGRAMRILEAAEDRLGMKGARPTRQP